MRGEDEAVLWFLGGVRFGPAAPMVVMELGRISILEAAETEGGRAGFLISEADALGAGGGGNSLRRGFGDVGIELDS